MFLFYLVLLALAVVADLRDTIWFVPLALSVVCAILWFVARRQLGASFSVRPEAQPLVTTGLYAKLRHPIYLAFRTSRACFGSPIRVGSAGVGGGWDVEEVQDEFL